MLPQQEAEAAPRVRAEPTQRKAIMQEGRTMDVSAIQPTTPASSVSQNDGFDKLKGEDFLELLIAQLVNQDPLEPTSNQELLQQIATIRDIEQSTALTDSLENLTDQQRFGAAAALVGQFVTGRVDAGGGAEPVSGTVTAVRFDADGQVTLMLDSGRELHLTDLETVTSAGQAAGQLIGKLVAGPDASDPSGLTVVEGVVSGLRTGANGEVLLELDTGEQVRFVDAIASVLSESDPGPGTSAG